jgi:GNAT superfamily N-acetyltransferase
MSIGIRPAEARDAEAVARLVTQLGYPTTTADMQDRLRVLLSHPDYHVVVAERNGAVAGIAGAHVGRALESDGVHGRVIALAVDEGCKRCGIGTRLMEYLEGWLKAQGAVMLILTSGNHRTEAHEFYRALGYDQTGVRFVKRL